MHEPLPDVWNDRDLPVLREIVRALDGPVRAASVEAIAAHIGLDNRGIQSALRHLESAHLIGCAPRRGSGDVDLVTSCSAEALRLTGAWPTPDTALDRMITALEAIADNTDDEDTRTLARKLRDGMTGASKHVALAAITAAVTGQLPH